jgi:long-chain acyl-CoA synthetase
MYYKELKAAWSMLTGPGAPFEIVSLEVGGEMLRCFKNAPPSVRELWLSTAAYGDRDYIVYQDERITYAQAHATVNAVAAWLARQGVKPGDRVAIAMRNYPEWMLIYWACVCTGVAVVGVNAWWVPAEMSFGLKDSTPKVTFCDQERLERVLEDPATAATTKLVAVRVSQAPANATLWADVIREGGAMPAVAVDPDADACIFYTSGTTGFPKGAQLTHRGCVANLFNMMFAGQAQAIAVPQVSVMP